MAEGEEQRKREIDLVGFFHCSRGSDEFVRLIKVPQLEDFEVFAIT